MSDVTELKCWPACLDAIDWSPDGIVALASDEVVQLLFPSTEPYDKDQEDTSWHHSSLQIPWFTSNEFPEKEPAPIPTYSVGEEISVSFPTIMAWSPPGLAKHRRCALGVLTSNLVLSIWAADGKPQDESSWERRLIVNDALADYFVSDAAQGESALVSEATEKMRLRIRIRSFAWAPTLSTAQPSGIVGTQATWGQHIVAISNDDNQIVLVVIDSPTSTLGAEETWSGEVLNHFAIIPDSGNVVLNPTIFDEFMQQQRHISHLAWSPWTLRGDLYQSVLVYATNEDVRARIVTYTHDTIGLGDEVIYPDIQLRHQGPIKWSPQVENGEKLILSLFTRSGMICLVIAAMHGTILARFTHHLDGRWDEVSGVLWDHTPNGASDLHLCSLQSTMTSPTAVLRLSESGLIPQDSPGWREHIKDAQTLFSAQNELKGNVKSKVWGLCTSSLGDFIVACHTLHPSDMIEYGPPSDRRCTIATNGLRSYNQPMNFPTRNVSAEGIVFTLKKWLENTVENADGIPMFIEGVLAKLNQVYVSAQDVQRSNDTTTELYALREIGALIAEFKQNVFLDPNSLKDRYSILVNRTCSPSTSNDLARTLIAFRLANAVQSCPALLSHATPFSRNILAAHRRLVALISSLMNEDIAHASEPSIPSSINAAGAEICDFCQSTIPFTDLHTAQCLSGHHFQRCGLSFLAIQAPRITKYCGLCSTPYLSDEFVLAQEKGDGASRDENAESVEEHPDAGAAVDGENEQQRDREMTEARQTGIVYEGDKARRELPVSLARMLFLACDACIYCGGKFLG